MDQLKKQLEKEYQREQRKLVWQNGLRNALPTGGIVLYLLLTESSEGSTELLIALLLYSLATIIVSAPFFIKYHKLTKEYNRKSAELDAE